MRAISAMGSIEALVPGLAPIMGLWLYSAYGWESTFTITAILVSIVCVIVILRPKLIPSVGTKKQTGQGSYLALLKNTTYIRYAMGHALTVGGLIAFVFTAPAVIIETMGGTIEDFILMQMVGVATFFVAANTTGSLVKKWGAETIIMLGTLVCVGATLILIAYALWGPNKPQHLVAMFWVLNTGVGLRAGPCFVSALKAAVDDDDRASALMILSITAIIALATAALAPLISLGLLALTITTFLIVVPALLLMIYIKPVNSTVGPQTTP
ncbi:MAG: MFS transporter [Kordiimonadaceae bacterium]|nr:MFS transporter [Kordiimonadaceae bacterium]